jgi:hypothetical protein
VILTSECRTLGEGAISTYFKRLRFDAAGTSGVRTHDLPNAKREHYKVTATGTAELYTLQWFCKLLILQGEKGYCNMA